MNRTPLEAEECEPIVETGKIAYSTLFAELLEADPKLRLPKIFLTYKQLYVRNIFLSATFYVDKRIVQLRSNICLSVYVHCYLSCHEQYRKSIHIDLKRSNLLYPGC